MFVKKTVPALILGFALVAGCESLTGDRDNNNDDTLPPRHDRISTRDRGGYEGDVMKYPADFDYGIPSGAHLAREVDQDGSVTYKAPHDAKLYLFDADSRRVVWSGSIRDGERFAFDSRDNRATVNDQSILNNNRDLNPDHRYRLYAVRNSTSDSLDSSSRSRDTSADRP